MEEFYKRYLRVCKECVVSPLECVLSQLQPPTEDDAEGRVLDLSSYNFTPDDCNALAKALSYDTYFKEVRFNDCLLSEDASKMLLYGLRRSRSLETIDLKGNNLRCSGAEAVGVFLKKNLSVRCLRLDWNSLGLWGTGVGAIAEGLAVNQTVVLLDLRNNQISHEGATELASCLKRNSTLKALDLRWNNAGLLGGRAFLTAMQYNKSLTLLDLQGNNVPQDILKAISVAIKLNGEREAAQNKENARTEKMIRTIEKIELENTMQVSMLQDKLEEQSRVNEELSKSNHSKIKRLKESLDKNKTTADEISKELQSTKTELKMRNQEISDLNDLINELKNELAAEKAKGQQLENEVRLLKESRSKLEQNVNELETKKEELQNVVGGLESDIAKINVEQIAKLREITSKHEESVAYASGEHASELKHLHSNFKEKESIMKYKIESLEKEKMDAEEKISQLKSEIMSSKLKAEEDVFNVKAQHKHEDLVNSKQYEDRISALQTSRDEQHVQISKYLNQISELQRELNLKEKMLTELKEETDTAAREMQRKESNHKTEIGLLKMNLESEKKVQDSLRHQMSNLELNIKENGRKQKELIAEKDREIESLEERLKARETDLKRRREDEIRRADLLESAIFNYVNSTRSSRPPSPSK